MTTTSRTDTQTVVKRCPVCGGGVSGRSDARYCSTGCRVEAWRVRRLLDGKRTGPYTTLNERMAAFGADRRQSRNTSDEGGM